MRQNNTVFYTIAGVFWTIQTVLALINLVTGEAEGLGMLIGIGLTVIEGICAYALFTGDTYKFYKSIKILSIAITVSAVIIFLTMIRLLSILPGVFLGLMLLLALLSAQYWALTDVAKKTDDNDSVEKSWYIPGIIYLVSIIFSYAYLQSIVSKYGVDMNVGGALISDNLVMLIFGVALFFFTGYSFYYAQKSAVNNISAYQSGQNYPNNAYNNVYSNANNTYNAYNNVYSNANNTDAYSENNSGYSQAGQQETENSGSSKFTLKKD